MRSTQKTLAMWALLVVVAIILFQFYDQKVQSTITDFNYGKFIQAVKDKDIKPDTITFNQQTNEISGELKDELKEKNSGAQKFTIVGNTEEQSFKILQENGYTPNYVKNENSGFLQSIFVNWLPLIIIFLMFMFFMKQIQVGGGKAMSFGKSKAKLLTENKNKVTFKDVAGVEEAKEDLTEIIDFLKSPRKFTNLGGRIPKGVLLVGPPGTGKTLLARAVAGEAGVPFFTISGSDFVEMFVGVGASRVRDLFEQGKRSAPCIIFIDEIDAVGRHRGAGMGGGHDEREQTLNQLLVEMDGFESNEGVILIAATNRPDVLDPALLRPGRFDRRVIVGKPDVKGRIDILKVHTRKTPLASEVLLEKVARGTPGFSGADLENLVNEAALMAARFNKKVVDMHDFENARDKVLMGPERKSMVINEDDKKNTAYHEAGHTIVAKKLTHMDPIHKVTIIPRGMALGVTQTLPLEDRLNFTREKARNMIAFMFGGRAAEEIVFTDFTTGAANDIERATELARKMVCEWGMSDKLGPLHYEKREGHVFMGLNSSQPTREYSEQTGQEIDSEVRRLVKEGHERAVQILKDNLDVLHNLSLALLEKETLDGVEVEMIMTGKTLADIDKERELRAQTLVDQNKKQEEENKRKELEEARLKDELKKPSGGGVGNTGPVTT
jgi:cell division protease FtsH